MSARSGIYGLHWIWEIGLMTNSDVPRRRSKNLEQSAIRIDVLKLLANI